MRASRVDANQPDIVKALRQAGASVQHLHKVGGGCPDLLVGFRRQNYLMEVKDGALAPSARQLNDKQQEWHDGWKGIVHTVKSEKEALTILGLGVWAVENDYNEH